jgi:hypothetical protein
MGHTSRTILVGIIAAVLAGCVSSDDGRHVTPNKNGTVERMVASAQRKYDRDQADAWDKIADDMEGGKVYDKGELWTALKDGLAKKYKADFAEMNKLMDNIGAQHRDKYGKRESKYVRAIARGFRSLNSDEPIHRDDERDDE